MVHNTRSIRDEEHPHTRSVRDEEHPHTRSVRGEEYPHTRSVRGEERPRVSNHEHLRVVKFTKRSPFEQDQELRANAGLDKSRI
jgi:hypothetical protein